MKAMNETTRPLSSASRPARGALGLALAGLLAGAGGIAPFFTAPLEAQPPGSPVPEWTYRELEPPSRGAGPPVPTDLPVQLVLDDGTPEGAFGVSGVTSRPFLWFQVFQPPVSDFDLHELWVLFPSDPEIAPGDSIQLVVYRDNDDNPAAGTELLAAVDTTVQVADGGSFSVYPLAEPIGFRSGERAILGVVSRFVDSGSTPPTEPAALDTSSSAGRAWVATWTGDPPDPPTLPSDQSLFPIDTLVAGNWMIRGFGTPTATVEVPVGGAVGTALLGLLLLGLGIVRLRGGGS